MKYTSKPVNSKMPSKPNLEGTNPRVNAGVSGKGVEIYQGHMNRPGIDGANHHPLPMVKDQYAVRKMAEFRKAGE